MLVCLVPDGYFLMKSNICSFIFRKKKWAHNGRIHKKYLLLRMSFSTERILARVKYVTKKTVSENYEETWNNNSKKLAFALAVHNWPCWEFFLPKEKTKILLRIISHYHYLPSARPQQKIIMCCSYYWEVSFYGQDLIT